MSLAKLGIVRTSPKEIAEDFRTGRAFREGGDIAVQIGEKAEKISPFLALMGGPLIGGLTAAWGVGMMGAGGLVGEFGRGVEAGEVTVESGARMASAVNKIAGIEKGVTDALERNKGMSRTTAVGSGALPRPEKFVQRRPGEEEIPDGHPDSDFMSNGQRKRKPYPNSEEYKAAQKVKDNQAKEMEMKIRQQREAEALPAMKHSDINLANPNESDIKNLSLFEKVKYFAAKKDYDRNQENMPRSQGLMIPS